MLLHSYYNESFPYYALTLVM